MNIAKTNTRIAEMYRLGEAVEIQGELDKSPLLTLTEQDWWHEVAIVERKWSELKFPFDHFRFHYQLLQGDQVSGYFVKTEDGFRVVGHPPHVAEDQWFCAWYRDGSQGKFQALWPDGKGEAHIEDVKTEGGLAQSGWQLHMDIASKFALFYVEMGMPVAEVTPPHYDTAEAIRRKVSWRKRRDYYTVLDAAHKANDRKLKHGASVSLSDKDIERCAHHRRAHWRTLKAEKWGASRGKRVFVRQTWVGPSEWRESNQVYRITNLEPN